MALDMRKTEFFKGACHADEIYYLFTWVMQSVVNTLESYAHHKLIISKVSKIPTNAKSIS